MSKFKRITIIVSLICSWIFIHLTVMVDLKFGSKISTLGEITRCMMALVVFYWCRYCIGQVFKLFSNKESCAV